MPCLDTMLALALLVTALAVEDVASSLLAWQFHDARGASKLWPLADAGACAPARRMPVQPDAGGRSRSDGSIHLLTYYRLDMISAQTSSNYSDVTDVASEIRS